MSLWGSEKWKKKKTAKVIIDNNEIVEVAGPSSSRSGLNSGAFLERMEADSHSGGDDRADGLDHGLHMICIMVKQLPECWPRDILKECCFFTAPWDEAKESEDSEAEVNPEEVEQEIQGLQEEKEEPGSSVPE